MALERNQIAKEEAIKVPLELADNFEVLLVKLKETIKTLGAVNQAFSKNPGLKESKENTEKLRKAQTDLDKIQKDILRNQDRLSKSYTEEARVKARLQVQNQERNKQLKQEAKESLGLVNAYDRLTRELNEARAAYKNLAASGTASTKQLRAQQQVVQNLDSRVKKIDASVGQFQRNVGNYPQLLGSATNALKNFAAAFGVIGGIQLFARAIQDTFRRIREFDKEIVNLAAIAGKTRPQIKNLENEIKRVAATSVNTANEVAQLATELIKLGSTDKEAEKLLKPVNDFSIALRASAEESASFLKGVLNAFGVGAEEAGRFGDVLSKAANRSALDFQKLTESFGFVAPTARQLGIPVERLAAQIGTLADNNIKASRAGRLLNTSFARLITRGLTLDQALDQIRESTDKVKTAAELFGAESFTIGLILADNEEKVNSLTKEFENSQGTLEELTNKQLASLDAKLKILDSSWEAFILSVEDGQGVIGGLTHFFIDLATSALNAATAFGEIQEKNGFWITLGAYIRAAGGDMSRLIELNALAASGFDKFQSIIDRTIKGVKLETLVNDIDFFEKEVLKAFLNSGIGYEESAARANIWRQQTIQAFEETQKTVKGFGETTEEIIGNQFAQALEALSEGGLKQFLIDLKQRQAELVREFDKIGGSITEVDKMTEAQKNLKEEIDKVGKNIQIVNNAIAVLGDDGVKEVTELANRFKTQFDKINKDNAKSIEDSIKDQQKAIEKALKERAKAYEDQLKEEERLEDEPAQRKEQIINDSINLIGEIIRGFADLRIQQISDELNALQHKRDRQIEFIQESGATEEQKEARIAAVNAKFDAKERQLKQQQARAEKQAALFQIAINTAVGVAKTLAQFGFTPAAAAPIALAIALGAAQSAFVAAQPLPKFKEGSKGKKVTGPGEWGEAGTEMAVDEKGNLRLSPSKRSITFFNNEEIIPHDMTMKILANSLARNISRDSRSFEDERIVNTLEKTSKNVVRAINKKPVPIRDGYIINGTRVKQLNFWRNL